MTQRNLAFLEGALADKTAIVTGAGQGLGRDIAIALTQAGARVAVVDINPETAAAVAGELADYGAAGVAITCDVSKRDQVDATVEKVVAEFGGVDVLVNNAQNVRMVQKPFMETDDEHLLTQLTSGLFGTYYFLQACSETLRARGGRVINLGSGAGVSGNVNHFSYAAAKEAIRATTRVVAREWGRDGVRVNAICPAAFDTPAMKGFLERAGEEQLEGMLSQIPLHRFGGGDEVASVAVFLASDASSFMTGHTLMVDGGSNMDAGR
ncbi:SDR family NAD(P)-dependent oxidoreductase [Agromyces mangrovi Wang et al. 2018]|uniref:SDR family NAD(P)-dependent oxidoreductase n=1 Tax=Agromyces mangrovi TaxID=1858653 RepID=UPI002573C246|nr:SDR family oxidoreductase [Agromyces mangrovi]BDZ65073.1 short-chain dehydrogenase [Agromyces mangrovi]